MWRPRADEIATKVTIDGLVLPLSMRLNTDGFTTVRSASSFSVIIFSFAVRMLRIRFPIAAMVSLASISNLQVFYCLSSLQVHTGVNTRSGWVSLCIDRTDAWRHHRPSTGVPTKGTVSKTSLQSSRFPRSLTSDNRLHRCHLSERFWRGRARVVFEDGEVGEKSRRNPAPDAAKTIGCSWPLS